MNSIHSVHVPLRVAASTSSRASPMCSDGADPTLVDFLCSPGLAREPPLRNALLKHVLATHALSNGESWLRVLREACKDVSCSEVVVEAVKMQGAAFTDAIMAWAHTTTCDAAIPLNTRLLLHLVARPGTPAPEALSKDAASALLTGSTTLPPEALQLLDIPQLWLEALRGDAHFAVAALLQSDASSSSISRIREIAVLNRALLVPFLQRGLRHQKRAVRAACIQTLRALQGEESAALLSLLSAQQPMHLLSAVEALPPPELHDAAAMLALYVARRPRAPPPRRCAQALAHCIVPPHAAPRLVAGSTATVE